MALDPLFDEIKYTSKTAITRKENDLQNARQFTLSSASLTATAIFFEVPGIFLFLLSTATLLLASCWKNESKRLAILKSLPIKLKSSEESSDTSTPSTPFSASPLLRQRRASTTPATTTSNRNSPISMA